MGKRRKNCSLWGLYLTPYSNITLSSLICFIGPSLGVWKNTSASACQNNLHLVHKNSCQGLCLCVTIKKTKCILPNANQMNSHYHQFFDKPGTCEEYPSLVAKEPISVLHLWQTKYQKVENKINTKSQLEQLVKIIISETAIWMFRLRYN